jgi:hypothetical protein
MSKMVHPIRSEEEGLNYRYSCSFQIVRVKKVVKIADENKKMQVKKMQRRMMTNSNNSNNNSNPVAGSS